MSVSLTHVSTGHHARMGLTSTFVTASQDTSVSTARKKRVSEGQMDRNGARYREAYYATYELQIFRPSYLEIASSLLPFIY